jgi:hypothetical protein
MHFKILNRLRTLLVKYGLPAGTAILLFSWIVEKYQADYWDQKLADLSELRSQTLQELILAQSNAMFLTRKAETQKIVSIFETNQDVVNALSAYAQAVQILHRKLPASYHEGLKLLEEMLNKILGMYASDVEKEGERRLSEEEIQTVSALSSQALDFLSVGESALATEVFYEAGVERLLILKNVIQALEDHKDYDHRLKSLTEEMRRFAECIYTGRPPATSVTSLIDRLYSLTEDINKDIHTHVLLVTQKKYQYAVIHKIFYILGSILILGSMIAKKDTA